MTIISWVILIFVFLLILVVGLGVGYGLGKKSKIKKQVMPEDVPIIRIRMLLLNKKVLSDLGPDELLSLYVEDMENMTPRMFNAVESEVLRRIQDNP